MQTAKIRFAIVGAGAVARAYGQAFQRARAAELVAVADLDLQAAAALADPFDCRIFDSHASLLRAGGFDAALICTPPASHASISLDLLRCGVHVVCETPLSTDIASARRMLHEASRFGVKLAAASKFRYVDDVIQAQAFISAGRLGEVLTFENEFRAQVKMAGGWHANPITSGGGVIADSGTHSVDLLRYLCGPIAAVAAYEGTRVQRLAVEDTAHVVARTNSGVLASIDLSWSCSQESDNYLRLCGTDGALTLGWARSRYRHTSSSGWISFGYGYDQTDALCGQLDNFCSSLNGKEPLLATPEDALAAVQAIAAAYRSLRSNRWVAIDSGTSTGTAAPPELAPVSAVR